MDYIARHYHMDLALARPPRLSGQSISSEALRSGCYVTALHFRGDAVRARDGGRVWALRLEGKTDQEKLKLTAVPLQRDVELQ
ncbi:MAG: hypothetical protein U9R02_10995 [Thermodesulfobacteriota bacterium]|nr:hypothetical protein [Thermodesulfobacteriota bacterium]